VRGTSRNDEEALANAAHLRPNGTMHRHIPSRPRRPWLLRLFVWTVSAIATLIALALALYGAWIGSTLAIYNEQPAWIALVGSVLVFAVLPLVWELLADRHQVGGRIRDAILRSSFLSSVLLVVLLLTHADTTFQALATRGDWFLGDARTPAAESARRFTHTLADGFEWLDHLARRARFADADTTRDHDPSGSEVSRRDVAPRLTWPIPGTDWTWPIDPEVGPHPSLDRLPDDLRASTTTPAALGRHFAVAVSDELERAKAIHDYVVTQIAYDHAGLVDGSYRRGQDAETVLRRRAGVCSGLSNLFAAIAQAAGLEAVVIAGQIRWASDYGDVRSDAPFDAPLLSDERGHAWNAVRVNGRWHLVDTTWNLPNDHASYRTDYLFTPPQLMTWSHLPESAEWQLLDEPLSYSEWLRQPTLNFDAARLGLDLGEQGRPVLPRSQPFRLVIDNPYGHTLSVSLEPARVVTLAEHSRARLAGRDGVTVERTRCGDFTQATRAVFECDPPPYRFAARIFARHASEPRDVHLWSVGQITVDGP